MAAWSDWTYIPVACAALGLLVFLQEWSVRRRVLGRMSGRESLAPQELARRHFGDDAAKVAIALQVISIVRKQLGLDLSRLRPEDDFARNLEIDELDSLASVTIVMDIEKAFGIKIPDEDAAKITNVRDLVNYVDARTGGPGR